MCLWNSRSIVNKLPLFQSFLSISFYKVYAVVESWCSSSVLDKEIIVPGYSIFRKDRDCRGGGVFLVVHDSIPARRISSPVSLELVVVEIQIPRPVILCLVYIPPAPEPASVYSIINFLSSIVDGHNIILLEDFNFPDINWDNLTSSSHLSNFFCDFVFDNDLLQFVKSPTHCKGNILDLILSNSPDLIYDVSVHSSDPLPTMRSNHNLISFAVPCSHSKSGENHSCSVFMFHKGNYDLMNEYIAAFDFSPFYSSTDVEFLWSFLKSLIHDCYRLFIPTSRSSVARFPRWFTGDVIRQVHKVKFLRGKTQSSPTVHNTLLLKSAERTLTTEVTSAKTRYESYLVRNFAFKKTTPIYNYIRSFTKQSSYPSVMSLDSHKESSNLGRATIFNEFFHSVFSNKSASLPLSMPGSPSNATICNEIPITIDNVFEVLSHLDTTKAMGIDQIPNCVLKFCSDSLCEPICYLFQQCINQSYLPSEWRIHKVTPIFKSGDKSSVKNYRPISLLCCISKVLELIVYNNIYDHVSSCISTNQFGFLRNRSTVQQLLTFLQSLHNSFAQKSLLPPGRTLAPISISKTLSFHAHQIHEPDHIPHSS